MTALTYEYRAVDQSSARRRGVLPAANESEAYRKITAMGLTPIGLKSASSALRSSGGRRSGRRIRISGKDLAHFTYQLGVLVASRIPLSEGLRSIADQEREGGLKTVIADVAHRIESGEQVAQAMAAHSAAFGDVYIETVRAAERSGNLSKALEQLSESLERGQEMTRQVRGAMMYPLCVSGVLALAVTFLVGFVVPRFARMFAQRNLELPAFTRALMAFGNSLQTHWWLYLLGIAGMALVLRSTWRHPHGRILIDRSLNRVPYFTDILRGLALSRFCRVLGLSLSSGLGLIEALELAGRSSGRPLMMRDAEHMAARVRRGGRLGESLAECNQITGFTRRMLTAGEQTGELPHMCSIISRHYERETSHLVKNIATIIEPIMIVVIAGMVLVIALAIFLPMWDMVKLVG